jgi:cation:H+ antiporter
MLWFVLGLVALVLGAELLVKGASRLALSFGISPLVVGLTVVAFGTSAPEMAVSVQSAWSGQVDIALGNVVGSNIFNVLVILGLSALITPLVVHQQVIRQEVPVMIGVSLLLWALALDGGIGRSEGLLLVGLGVAYTILLIRQSRRETAAVQAAVEAEYAEAFDRPRPGWRDYWGTQFLLILAGFALLLLGSRWLVEAAVGFARHLGVSELVIGLTIVAAGTSLPEVATSILAAIRGERDIAVGNVVGSNLFNVLAVLGLGSLVAPDGVPVPAGALTFDLPIMIAVSIACLPVFLTGYTIARWEGAVFLGYYVAYVAFLVADATGHVLADRLGQAIVWFVLPLTVLTLVVSVVRHRRAAGRRG